MRIDILNSTKSQYSVINHFSAKMHEAFLKLGTDCRLVTSHGAAFFEEISQNPPDFTFCFNGVAPNPKGLFFFDHIKIPHVSYIIDSPMHCYHEWCSKYGIITCIDRHATQVVRGINPRALFLPHAVESSIAPDPSIERIYDVVMLGTCFNHETIYKQWRKKYPLSLCHLLVEAADIALSDQTTPYYETLDIAFNNQSISHRASLEVHRYNAFILINEIESYMRGKDRISLIKGITDANIHIFGNENWNKVISNQPNVILHPGVEFEEAIKIMKQSKIILNSCPSFKYGAHERIFTASACGALVIATGNVYLQEQFQEDESMAFYQHQKWDKLNATIKRYLANEKKRLIVAKKGRDIVMQFHTWDQRAAQLIKELPPLLEQIRSSGSNVKTP